MEGSGGGGGGRAEGWRRKASSKDVSLLETYLRRYQRRLQTQIRAAFLPAHLVLIGSLSSNPFHEFYKGGRGQARSIGLILLESRRPSFLQAAGSRLLLPCLPLREPRRPPPSCLPSRRRGANEKPPTPVPPTHRQRLSSTQGARGRARFSQLLGKEGAGMGRPLAFVRITARLGGLATHGGGESPTVP